MLSLAVNTHNPHVTQNFPNNRPNTYNICTFHIYVKLVSQPKNKQAMNISFSISNKTYFCGNANEKI